MDKTEYPRWCRPAAAALLHLAVASMFHASSVHGPESTLSATARGVRRELSVALPGGGCQVTNARPAPAPIRPTWQASFPGSGSRMTFLLVQSLTGIRTNDDYDSNQRGYESIVSVKTHYPVKNARGRFRKLDRLFGRRAMVILRNPINAIPSYFNLQYELMHKLPNHSTRGPNKDWLEYREDQYHGVFIQIENYEKFVRYWMEKYTDRSNLLVLSYEDLTDAYSGAITAAKIANFLGKTDGVDPIAIESVPCVWDAVVNYKNHVGEVTAAPPPLQGGEAGLDQRRGLRVIQFGGTNRTSSLRTGPKVRPYSKEQLGGMADMFRRLLETYADDEDLVRIISSYIGVVLNTPIEEEPEEGP